MSPIDHKNALRGENWYERETDKGRKSERNKILLALEMRRASSC